MAEAYPGEPESFAVHPDAYEVTADGATTYGHYHGGEDMATHEIQEAAAEVLGTTPDRVRILTPDEARRSRKFYGIFSSATWTAPYTPAGRGPIDPSLN